MAKYKIFVDGSSGTTGLRIADRLAARDEFEILHISEADRKDVNARAAVINQSDLSFLCLPDAAAREVVPLLRPDVRILDTSTAHRTAPDWVYGLPELHGKRDALRTANRVAVPGCYATGFITLVAPLVELGLLAADYPLTCHGLSGYSGAGKSGIAQYRDPVWALPISICRKCRRSAALRSRRCSVPLWMTTTAAWKLLFPCVWTLWATALRSWLPLCRSITQAKP